MSSLHSVSKPAEQERKTSPAQHTECVRRRQGQHHPLQHIIPPMAVRPHWQPARVLVDSGSEHPPLISQDLEDHMGMTGVRAGGATQADGACLPLFDIGCLDLAVNGERISHNFLSAPLSHCDIILGESWLRQHHRVLHYVHNDLFSGQKQVYNCKHLVSPGRQGNGGLCGLGQKRQVKRAQEGPRRRHCLHRHKERLFLLHNHTDL